MKNKLSGKRSRGSRKKGKPLLLKLMLVLLLTNGFPTRLNSQFVAPESVDGCTPRGEDQVTIEIKIGPTESVITVRSKKDRAGSKIGKKQLHDSQ